MFAREEVGFADHTRMAEGSGCRRYILVDTDTCWPTPFSDVVLFRPSGRLVNIQCAHATRDIIHTPRGHAASSPVTAFNRVPNCKRIRDFLKTSRLRHMHGVSRERGLISSVDRPLFLSSTTKEIKTHGVGGKIKNAQYLGMARFLRNG